MKWHSILTTLCLAAVSAAALSQSLGDAAQKEKERRRRAREQSGGEARVVTEAELKSNSGKLANDPSAKAPSAAPGANPLTLTLSPDGSVRAAAVESSHSDEARWRNRVAQADRCVQMAQERYDDLERTFMPPGGRNSVAWAGELQRLTAEAKASLEAAQKAREDLHESARRQGVPPGWLR